MVLETLTVTDSRVHPVTVKKGEPIKWSMVVAGEMTVELSVYFRASGTGNQPIEVPVVNVLHCETASHEWTCPEDGELVFLFDNSFSWFNDKVLSRLRVPPPPPAHCFPQLCWACIRCYAE
eukprot:COSAG03_NODE_98_length_13005_cov_17.216953_10_plen_121_part_00